MHYKIADTKFRFGLTVMIIFLAIGLGSCAVAQVALVAQEEQTAANWLDMLAAGGHKFKGQGMRTSSAACWNEGGEIILTIKPPRNPGEPNPVALSAKFKGDFGPGCEVVGSEMLNYPAWGEFDSTTGQIKFTTCDVDGSGTAGGFIHAVQKTGLDGEFICYAASGDFLYKLNFHLEYVDE